MKRFLSTFLVVFVSFVVVEVMNSKVLFKDCGSKESKVLSVSVNCSVGSGGVELKKGTYVQLQIEMLSEEVSKTLKAVVHGIIADVPVPFPLSNPDGCKGCNVSCPIQNKKAYYYSPVIYVDPSYPSVKLLVKWELQDDKTEDLFCIIIPAVIVS